jgi:hypothetical protein
MKQKTSVYLDDLDRDAVQNISEYYGITSDTDVLCFSVRAVARAIPKKAHKGAQAIMVPVQDGGLMAQKQWQVDVYTSREQSIPHTFYDETLVALRNQVSSWLISAHPTYIKSGGVTYEKEGKHWEPFFTETDKLAYRDFCNQKLDIQRGPEYEERGFIDGKFSLEHVRKTLKYGDPDEVNKMLQRGWHIIAFQNKQSPDEYALYILGHTEQDAF